MKYDLTAYAEGPFPFTFSAYNEQVLSDRHYFLSFSDLQIVGHIVKFRSISEHYRDIVRYCAN